MGLRALLNPAAGDPCDADTFDPTGNTNDVLTKLAPTGPGQPPGYGWRSKVVGLIGVTFVFYVDPTTTVAAAQQNGNDEAPYSTMRAALLNCTNAANSYLIIAKPADYSAEVLPVAPAIAAARINIENMSSVSWTFWGGALQNAVVLPGWVCPAGQLILKGCLLTDVLTCNALATYWTDLNRIDVTGRLEFYDSRELNQIDHRGGNITGENSFVTGILTSTQTDPGLAHFANCNVGTSHWQSAAGGVMHNVEYISCTMAGNIDTGGIADQLNLTVRNCDCGGNSFDASAGTGFLDIDAMSLSTILEANITGFTMPWNVQFRTQQARITVAVPAIVAAGLDYADVSTLGTPLEGIAADTPIMAHPTTDLAAAGAGNGGFINARVSALNTIRLAFVGILAGGNADFIFAQGGRAVP